MSALPVAKYLQDLSGDVSRSRGRSADMASEAAKGADAVARMAEAYGRGLAEGKAVAKAEFDERFAQQQAEFEQSLATERARWAEEEGRRLAGLLGMRLDELEATIAGQVTQILKPVFTEQVRKRAVAELASALESLMANGEFAKLTVSGPEDLLGMLSAQLNVKIGNVAFTPAPGCDLHLTVDQTVLETRIGAWVRAIEGKAP